MGKPEKPTPHIPYDLVEGGDRSTPVLTAYTHGGLGNQVMRSDRDYDRNILNHGKAHEIRKEKLNRTQ